jgi:hypothetical protein
MLVLEEGLWVVDGEKGKAGLSWIEMKRVPEGDQMRQSRLTLYDDE